MPLGGGVVPPPPSPENVRFPGAALAARKKCDFAKSLFFQVAGFPPALPSAPPSLWAFPLNASPIRAAGFQFGVL